MAATAKSGFENENWVVEQFNNYMCSYWAQGWLKTMNYNSDCIDHLCAQTTRRMGFFNKADVLVLVEGNVEWISVKKFTANFNQIDKKWTEDYAEQWNMPKEVDKVFKRYCGEPQFRPRDLLDETKLKHVRDKRRFWMHELSQVQREQVLDFLNNNRKKIVEEVVSGKGKASAKWMLLVEVKNDTPYRSVILPIKRVIEYCTGGASITDRGNLKLGELRIQRKGGDSGKPTAQMLQFKFSPRGIFDIQGIDIIESRISTQHNSSDYPT